MGCINFETVLKDFVSKLVVIQNIFPLLSKALWSTIDSCYCILFSNLKQKNNIISSSSWVNRYHMGPTYIETSYTYLYFIK